MPKHTFHYGLDISADIITAARAAVEPSGKIADISFESCPCLGIKDGLIQELGLLAENISGLLGRLSLTCPDKIKSLYVSMPSLRIKAKHSCGLLPISERSNKIITSSDVARVNQQAYNLGLNIEEQVLYSLPQWYTLDNQSRVSNPLGLYSHSLGVDFLLITALYSDMQNVVSAVEKAGYKTKAVVLSSLAGSFAALPPEAKAKGCCFLDIGFDSSRMLIFKDGILKELEGFDFGAQDLTLSLAGELKLPYELAQGIKASYGRASSGDRDSEQDVLVRQKDNTYRTLKRKLIYEIIGKKSDEMFSLIKERLLKYGGEQDYPAGIILSGRDVLLEGFLERLEAKVGLSAHLARMENPPLKDPSYATVVGLIKYAASCYPQVNLFKLSAYGNIFQKLIHKSRELYHEYF